MIFSIVILILIGVVAFFQYTQGFFSATLSAVIAVLAAALAVGYHEFVAASLLESKMPEYANSLALVAIFAIVYVLLRLAFDKMVPGNVRFSPLIDKIGAGVMGLIAGLFAVGVVALAADELPFGPSIGGYSRFELRDTRQVTVPREGSQAEDAEVHDEIKVEKKLESAPQKGLMIPVDDLVVGLASKLSDNGSLAGTTTVSEVHPDWIAEISAARFGIQYGAKKTAPGNRGQAPISVQGIATAPALPQIDGVISEIRGARDEALPPQLKPGDGEMILVVQVNFTTSAADSDNLIRFSCGATHLKTNANHDYYPVGTLEHGVVFADKPDDFLFAEAGSSANLVFVVPADEVKAKDEAKIQPDTLLVFKKLTRIDIGGKEIGRGLPSHDAHTIRQPGARKKGGDVPAPAASPSPAPKKSSGGGGNNSDNPVDQLPGRSIGL